MKLKTEHRDAILIVGGIASVAALGYLIFQSRKKSTPVSQPGLSVGNAMTAQIPIYSFANIGGSTASGGTTSAPNIGGSGVTPLSVVGQYTSTSQATSPVLG